MKKKKKKKKRMNINSYMFRLESTCHRRINRKDYLPSHPIKILILIGCYTNEVLWYTKLSCINAFLLGHWENIIGNTTKLFLGIFGIRLARFDST